MSAGEVELTRRDVLKASAMTAAAAIVGWHVPGAAARIIMPGGDDYTDPATIPANVNEVMLTYGAVVAASPGALVERNLDQWQEIAQGRLRRMLGEIKAPEGWALVSLEQEQKTVVRPGGDHSDPLNDHALFGLKQMWKTVRV